MKEGQAVWDTDDFMANAMANAQKAINAQKAVDKVIADTVAAQKARADAVNKESRAKERGMAVSGAKNAEWLAAARKIAKHVAESFIDFEEGDHGVTIDDVREAYEDPTIMEELGLGHLIGKIVWGNWTGSVFNEPEVWEFVTTKKCDHKGGHRRRVSVWRLR